MALHFSKEEFSSRKSKVLNSMQEQNLDALLMFRQESMYWLTGYDTFGYVFFQTLVLDKSGNIILLTRAPDLRQAQNTSNIEDIRIWVDKDGSNPTDDLKAILNELNLKGKKLGIEYEAYGLTGRNALRLNKSLENYCSLEDKSDLITKLRVVKSREEIIYVKGSGKDMGNIEEDGFPALEMKNLLSMRKLIELDDFQMVNYQRKYMLDTSFPNASVETLLHAFLPHKFVDHSHSNAILSLIDQPNPEKICKHVFGDEMGIVPYIMPGFELAKKASEVFDKNPNVKGLILLNHGIFTFANNAKESYERMIKYITKAEKELTKKSKRIRVSKYIEKKISISEVSNLIRQQIANKRCLLYTSPSPRDGW